MKKDLHRLQHREFTVSQIGYYTVLKPAQRFVSTLLHGGKRVHFEQTKAIDASAETNPLSQSLISEKPSITWLHIVLAFLGVTGISAILLFVMMRHT